MPDEPKSKDSVLSRIWFISEKKELIIKSDNGKGGYYKVYNTQESGIKICSISLSISCNF